jgi:hypothetical protein
MMPYSISYHNQTINILVVDYSTICIVDLDRLQSLNLTYKIAAL